MTVDKGTEEGLGLPSVEGQAPPVRASRGFGSKVLATSAIQVGLLLLSVPTSVITARVLGPAGRGQYAIALLLGTAVSHYASLGLAQSALYFMARNAYAPALILGNSLLLALGTSALGVGSGLVAVLAFGDSLFPDLHPSLVLLALALVPGNVFLAMLLHLLLGLHRVFQYNVLTLLRNFISLVGVTVLLLMLDLGVREALLAELGAFLLTSCALLYQLHRIVGGVSFGLNVTFLKDFLRYGLSAHFGRVALLFLFGADLYMISLYMTPAAVGVFSVAKALVDKMALISGGAATLIIPEVAAQDEETRRGFTPLVFKTIVLLSAAAAIGLAIVGPWLIRLLFSERYAGSAEPFMLLLPGAIALAAWSILDGDFNGRGKPLWSTYTIATGLGVSVVLHLLLIPPYGLAGAAAASTASYLLILAIGLTVYIRASGQPLRHLLVPDRQDIALYRASLARLVGRLRSR